jgi:hypothetical protein
VGLGHNSCPHPLGNNNEFHALTLNPNASGLARRDLIHTSPSKSSTQDLEKKKAELVTLHLLRLNQDIVAGSQKQKCELKYVMHIPKAEMKKKSGAEAPLCSLKNE